jgi:hypothetical protein
MRQVILEYYVMKGWKWSLSGLTCNQKRCHKGNLSEYKKSHLVLILICNYDIFVPQQSALLLKSQF